MEKEVILTELKNKKIQENREYKVLRKVHNLPIQRENIGKIISSLYYVGEDAKVIDLAYDFDKNKEIQAVGVIDSKNNLKGIIIRKDLFNLLGKPYGQDILRHKTVDKFRSNANKFSFDRNILSVAEEIRDKLSSTDSEFFLLFREEDKFAGIFTSLDMMMYLSLMTQRDMEMARELQNRIVKRDFLIEKDNFSISCSSHMAKGIGGDYYSVVNYYEKKWFFTICDVCGKGLAASLVSTSIDGMQRIYDFNSGPEKFISKLNNYIFNTFEFVTAAFVDFDDSNGLLRIFDMGHSYIYIFKSERLYRLRSSSGNIPLGIKEGVIPQCDTFNLQPGDLFMMITDGVVEQINSKGEEFGEKRLFKILKNYKNTHIARLKDKILEEIQQFQGSQPQHDDITIILLSYRGISPISSK